jgi:hypothetical protein
VDGTRLWVPQCCLRSKSPRTDCSPPGHVMRGGPGGWTSPRVWFLASRLLALLSPPTRALRAGGPPLSTVPPGDRAPGVLHDLALYDTHDDVDDDDHAGCSTAARPAPACPQAPPSASTSSSSSAATSTYSLAATTSDPRSPLAHLANILGPNIPSASSPPGYPFASQPLHTLLIAIHDHHARCTTS